MSTNTLPVAEAKQRLTELVKAAHEKYDRYLITRNGKRAAVIVSAEKYDSFPHREPVDQFAQAFRIRHAGGVEITASVSKTRPVKS